MKLIYVIGPALKQSHKLKPYYGDPRNPTTAVLGVTTRQVILLDLSSFSGSVKCKVSILIRSGLRDKVLSTHTSQRRLVQVAEVRWKVTGVDMRYDLASQEVELKVLPLTELRFIYI